MDTPTPTSADATLADLHRRLTEAATTVDLPADDALQLTTNLFRGGERSEAARLQPSDLLHPVRAIKIGRYALLLALLPDQPSMELVAETLRRFRNHCVIARSYLSTNAALDLHGILVGPRGSERMDEWRPLALHIERDDRVARKFAWLRPASPEADTDSFADLVKRTFLARPWLTEETFTIAALDNLNRAAAMWDTSVPRDTVEEWVKLSLSPRADADIVVDALVEAWGRRGRT